MKVADLTGPDLEPREIVVGTYQCSFRTNGRSKMSAFGGTDSWDEEIKRRRLGGVEFEVVLREKSSNEWWEASIFEKGVEKACKIASTPLIAAMRCFVASKFGETVDE